MPVASQATNAIMYAMGERYNITALKDLAEHKFASHEFLKWSAQLSEVIELVYTTTPDSDRRLRDLTRDTCAPHTSSLIHNQEIVEVMLKVPSFGIDLCKGNLVHSEHLWQREQAKMKIASEKVIKEQMIKAAKAVDEILEAREGIKKATAEVARKNRELTNAHSSTAAVEGKLRELRQMVNSADRCHSASCREVFTPISIDEIGPSCLPIIVRCSRCGAKHKRSMC